MISVLRSKSNPLIVSLILLTILSSLVSFAKFDHCRNTNWSSPDSYVHECYSDIPTLFSSRGLISHKWSYVGGEDAVEYPVITGAVMWATSWLAPATGATLRGYFDVNALLLALLFIFVVLLVWKIRPQFAYLLPLSPAVVASLYINWDLWGIVGMLLAIYFFDQRKFSRSATFLGISIATKFFPVFLILPIAVIFFRRGQTKELIKFATQTLLVWLLINLPVIITTPTGWWHFYKLNLDRKADWGSLWYALSLLGLNLKSLNNVTVIALLAVLTGVVVFLLEIFYVPSLADVSFIVLASTLCIGKVYSPQYVLWLTPLAVIALRERGQRSAFWVWQAGETVYHLAIWLHLAQVGSSHFGLPNTGFAFATLFRIATTLYLIAIFVRSALKRATKDPSSPSSAGGHLSDFLFGTASSYP